MLKCHISLLAFLALEGKIESHLLLEVDSRSHTISMLTPRLEPGISGPEARMLTIRPPVSPSKITEGIEKKLTVDKLHQQLNSFSFFQWHQTLPF